MKTRIAVAISLALAAVSPLRTLAAISYPVKTSDGKIAGVTLASGVRAFKGIPFAAPPTGNLRWKEPQPPARWEGVRKTETFGNVCVQPMAPKRVPNNVAVDLPDSPKMSEDCLYLNVWTAANRAGARAKLKKYRDYTRRRFGGRHPLCGTEVTSRIDVT